MATCKLCEERKQEIERILSAYKKEKWFLYRVIGVLLLALVFVVAFGADGLLLIWDKIGG